jgi:UDP-GlcNAc:undecaprenyl-phosphate GlcNAc-1-phosphate transferase
MGNTGSMTLGFAIAVCAWVLVYTGPGKSTTTFVPLVILGLPVTDTVLAFTRRLIKGKNPFSGDMFHIHHMLKYRYGLSPRWTVFILYGMSLVFGTSGLLVAILPELHGWILISVLFAGLIFFLHRLGYTHLLKSDKQTPQHFYAAHQGNGKTYTRVNGNGVAKGSKLDQIDKKH